MQTVAIKKNLILYFFVFERFAVQSVAIKKNPIQYFWYLNSLQCKPLQLRKILFCTFLYLNGLQCKLLQLRKILFSTFFVVEQFAVQTINNYGNVVYFYILCLNASVAIKKGLVSLKT